MPVLENSGSKEEIPMDGYMDVYTWMCLVSKKWKTSGSGDYRRQWRRQKCKTCLKFSQASVCRDETLRYVLKIGDSQRYVGEVFNQFPGHPGTRDWITKED